MIKKILIFFLLLVVVAGIGFLILIKLLDIDLTDCQETSQQHVLSNNIHESKVGELYARMYATEFDLKYQDVLTFIQLTGTTSDFAVGHIYFRTPAGKYLACGWYK